MAIKISGTTVINDSRNLTNIAAIDANTASAIASAGFLTSDSDGDVDVTGTVTATAFSGDGSNLTNLPIPSGVATLTGTQTLTNKTLTTPAISTPTMTGTITEDVITLIGSSVPLDPDNGSVQLHTLTSTTNYTDSFSSGEAITLIVLSLIRSHQISLMVVSSRMLAVTGRCLMSWSSTHLNPRSGMFAAAVIAF